jgi:hypothetical protein
MAGLAFAVSIDLFASNGKYMAAVWWIAIVVFQHFRLL